MARTVATRTNKLVAGDTVEFGNMFAGFTYGKVLDIDAVEGRPLKRGVLIRFDSGGVTQLIEGVGAIWYVVREAA
jgi:hypothetical protein